MSEHTIYVCDCCGKELRPYKGDNVEKVCHLSLQRAGHIDYRCSIASSGERYTIEAHLCEDCAAIWHKLEEQIKSDINNLLPSILRLREKAHD